MNSHNTSHLGAFVSWWFPSTVRLAAATIAMVVLARVPYCAAQAQVQVKPMLKVRVNVSPAVGISQVQPMTNALLSRDMEHLEGRFAPQNAGEAPVSFLSGFAISGYENISVLVSVTMPGKAAENQFTTDLPAGQAGTRRRKVNGKNNSQLSDSATLPIGQAGTQRLEANNRNNSSLSALASLRCSFPCATRITCGYLNDGTTSFEHATITDSGSVLFRLRNVNLLKRSMKLNNPLFVAYVFFLINNEKEARANENSMPVSTVTVEYL